MGDTTERYPELDEDGLGSRQREVFERIAAGPRGAVAGPLRVWLHSPELADRAQALGQFARYGSSLPAELSELAILVTARIWSSGFEWSHHAPIALRVGLPPEVVEAIGRAEVPALDGAARAVFEAAVALHRDRGMPDEIYRAARAALGLEGLVDLVGICGYYTLISMTINAFAVPDDGGPKLPALDLPPERMFRNTSQKTRSVQLGTPEKSC